MIGLQGLLFIRLLEGKIIGVGIEVGVGVGLNPVELFCIFVLFLFASVFI